MFSLSLSIILPPIIKLQGESGLNIVQPDSADKRDHTGEGRSRGDVPCRQDT